MAELGNMASVDLREEVFSKIGKLCMIWASLDHARDATIAEALNCSKDQARCIATQSEPVASRTKLLRLLLLTVPHDEGWLELTTELLNRIDRVAAKRNRIIHDAWDFESPSPQQVDKRAKIRKPRAFAAPAISTEIKSTSTPSQIEEAILEATICTVGLMIMADDLRVSTKESPTPPESSALALLDQVETLALQERQISGRISAAPSHQ